MQIYGDPKNSNKFFIYLDNGSISFLKDFETAKGYIQDPRRKEWFGKPLYCTNEEIIKGYDNKFYLKSKAPKDPNKIISYDNKTLFIQNTKKHIEKILLELSQNFGYDSFFEAISWKESKIKSFKQIAKDLINYRDELYTWYLNCYEKHKDQLENTETLLDLSNIYNEFINNLPKFNTSE